MRVLRKIGCQNTFLIVITVAVLGGCVRRGPIKLAVHLGAGREAEKSFADILSMAPHSNFAACLGRESNRDSGTDLFTRRTSPDCVREIAKTPELNTLLDALEACGQRDCTIRRGKERMVLAPDIGKPQILGPMPYMTPAANGMFSGRHVIWILDDGPVGELPLLYMSDHEQGTANRGNILAHELGHILGFVRAAGRNPNDNSDEALLLENTVRKLQEGPSAPIRVLH